MALKSRPPQKELLKRLRDRETNRAPGKASLFSLENQGLPKGEKQSSKWFLGPNRNNNPKLREMVSHTSVVDNVLKGWLPKSPPIAPDTQITAFGSCFAENISNWLSDRNYRVLTKEADASPAYVISCGESMVNTFVIRQQFEWAWEGKVFGQDLWHGYKAESFGYDPKVQAETKRIFDETDVFILTFGLSEVWYDEPTGNVFWRAVPKESYDPNRHKFRVSTIEENRENMRAIYALIRKHRPDAKVIFTLSPIPLQATFRDNSCLTSNSVSKSILRVAVDEVVREYQADGHLFYWPSYELVVDVFKLPFKRDRRHMERAVLDFIMTQFEHAWCHSDNNPPPSLRHAWVRACAAAGLLPADLENVCNKKNLGRLQNMIAKGRFTDDSEVNDGVIQLLGDLEKEWLAERRANRKKRA